LGWNVTVVTLEPSLWQYTDNPEETDRHMATERIRRVLTGHKWRMLAPSHLKCWNHGLGWVIGGLFRKTARYLEFDAAIGWFTAAENACLSFTPDDVDVILATAPPFSAFSLARRLSDRLGCPYVLDYRDLWSRNAYNPMPGAVRKEAQLVANSVAVTTVSPTWASILDNEFALGRKLHVVTNGWDPEEISTVVPHDFGHFAIVYAGTFYPPKRVISPLMEALQRLKTENQAALPEWHFHYYGKHVNHVHREAERFNLLDKVVLHGNVARADALSAVAGAGLAVVIASVAEEDSWEMGGMVTGKIFETIGLATRFALIAPRNNDARTIAESTKLGAAFTATEVPAIASFFRSAMVNQAPKPNVLDTYGWTTIAKRFDALLLQTR
jgi:glycosyltransferase involved in cell wall biosynthesis